MLAPSAGCRRLPSIQARAAVVRANSGLDGVIALRELVPSISGLNLGPSNAGYFEVFDDARTLILALRQVGIVATVAAALVAVFVGLLWGDRLLSKQDLRAAVSSPGSS